MATMVNAIIDGGEFDQWPQATDVPVLEGSLSHPGMIEHS